MTPVHPLALAQGPDGEHPASGSVKPDNSTAAAPTRRESNLCRQMYFQHAAKSAQAMRWCDACPYLWLWEPWDALDAMAAPERAATAVVGAPRPPTSVPEARRSVPARFGARASAAGGWVRAPHRRAPQAPLAHTAPAAKSAPSGARSARNAPVS